MKRVFIIANPVAGSASRRRIKKATSLLKSMGYLTELLWTENHGDGIRLSKEISKNHPSQDIHAIIAAGGDGTFNEVANGLIGTAVPMAILPLGTTNVLAKELRIPEKVEGALSLLKKSPARIFPARIKVNGMERYFLLMAGIGFDGESVYGVNKSLKKISGKLAYILSGIKNFIRYSPVPMNIKIDDLEVQGYNAVICKSACYGGYFRMAPDADLRKPELYAVVFTGKNRVSLLKYVAGVITTRHIKFRDVIYQKASKIVIEPERHVQIDGDYFGKGKVEITSSFEELRLFIP
ncbi:MAG: diacylglycerol kinase family lipid kinase [Thermodesulfovibrionales bacterium]|nr:diacylglycerol kinase family lipid kinase [Thermodesulfovibrionales bacterium]